MRCRWWPVVALVLGAFSQAPAQAGWWHDAYLSVKRDFLRNNGFPEPFNYQSRDQVRAPFAVQVHNGWRAENTLTAAHFDPATGRLTEAGQLKLEWIMIEVPPQFRAVYVERGRTYDETETRLNATRQAVVQMATPGEMPAVLVTNTAPRGIPADQIDATTRRYFETIPDPRLPTASSASGSGGGESQ